MTSQGMARWSPPRCWQESFPTWNQTFIPISNLRRISRSRNFTSGANFFNFGTQLNVDGLRFRNRRWATRWSRSRWRPASGRFRRWRRTTAVSTSSTSCPDDPRSSSGASTRPSPSTTPSDRYLALYHVSSTFLLVIICPLWEQAVGFPVVQSPVRDLALVCLWSRPNSPIAALNAWFNISGFRSRGGVQRFRPPARR